MRAEGLKPLSVEIVDSSACDKVLRLIDFKHHGDVNRWALRILKFWALRILKLR